MRVDTATREQHTPGIRAHLLAHDEDDMANEVLPQHGVVETITRLRLNIEQLFEVGGDLTIPYYIRDATEDRVRVVESAFFGKMEHKYSKKGYALGPLPSNYELFFEHQELYRRFGLMPAAFQYVFLAVVQHRLRDAGVHFMALQVRWQGTTWRDIDIRKTCERGDLEFKLSS